MTQKFYTLEGIDGSGKGTIGKFIKEHLQGFGIPTTVVEAYPRDPDSMRLRGYWINQEVPPLAVLAIILELRKRVLIREIIPALLRGHFVISDRWNDTTWAYQHTGEGIPARLMNEAFDTTLNIVDILRDYRHPETGNPLGENQYYFLQTQLENYKTFHLNIDVFTARQRMAGRNLDAFEQKPDSYFEKLIEGYKKSYHWRLPNHDTLINIDANMPLDNVKQQIVDYFKRIMK